MQAAYRFHAQSLSTLLRVGARLGTAAGWFPTGPPQPLTRIKGLHMRELVQIVQDESSQLSHTQQLLSHVLGELQAWQQLDVRLQVLIVPSHLTTLS